ncbi:MAG: hypothetical protein JW847_01515 [Candidatus Omnitrophica bacterium]|nr:hypothetical protein [Candidatus Omnitrophota bacterium]
MKIPFYQKFIRYLIVEVHWRVFLFIIAVLVVIIKIENGVIEDLSKDIKRLREQGELIARIPEFQGEIDARRKTYQEVMEQLRLEEEEKKRRKEEELQRLKEERRKKNLQSGIMELEDMVLQGITGAEGSRSALINGQIYNKEQKIGEYVITEILKDRVMLKDPVTQRKETLNLFEEEELREQ